MGKSRQAKRNVSLTMRVRKMLVGRYFAGISGYVFPGDKGGPIPVSSLDHVHSRVRRALKLPQVFVLHSLRHTFLTRLGLAGVEAFTIMKLAGHSSVTVSQRYVHPTSQAMEQAVAKLEAMNCEALELAPESENRMLPATVPATSSEATAVTH